MKPSDFQITDSKIKSPTDLNGGDVSELSRLAACFILALGESCTACGEQNDSLTEWDVKFFILRFVHLPSQIAIKRPLREDPVTFATKGGKSIE